ncbi:hypothetical protein [Echinicola rosea]|uniref:hypothetical protein n=1 Tax=Echinicola rosea TaxID=1807691 RepID=UPI0010CA7151|nr:hypothetical protein [Echinicola rosea]
MKKSIKKEKKQPSWRRGYFDGLMACFIATRTRSHQEGSWEVSCIRRPYFKKPSCLGAFVACFIATKTGSHQERELGGVMHSEPLLQKNLSALEPLWLALLSRRHEVTKRGSWEV